LMAAGMSGLIGRNALGHVGAESKLVLDCVPAQGQLFVIQTVGLHGDNPNIL